MGGFGGGLDSCVRREPDSKPGIAKEICIDVKKSLMQYWVGGGMY